MEQQLVSDVRRGAVLDELRAAPRERRGALLCEHLRRSLADEFASSPLNVPADRPFAELTLGADPGLRVTDALRHIVQRDLQVFVYPKEFAARPTLRALAPYLADEALPVERAVPAPFTDPYAGSRFAWPLPPELPSDVPRNTSAVFVLNATRSGSTLFRAMLAGHSGLFSPPELNLLQFDRMGARRLAVDRLEHSWMRAGLGTAIAELEGLDGGDVERRLALLEADDVAIQAVYAQLQEGLGARLLVDKSPLYALHPMWLARAEQLFEAPRYLFLVRHPLSAMESFVRIRFHRLLGRHHSVWDEHPWVFAEKVWAASNAHVLRFLATVDPSRWRRISYEELVRTPDRVMRRVCDLLGLRMERAMLSPYDAGRMTTSRDGRLTVGDPDFLTRSAIDPALADRWRHVRPPQRLSPFTRHVAAELGYELS
jgi:hypothetical protein